MYLIHSILSSISNITAQHSEAANAVAEQAAHPTPTGGAIFTHLYHHVLAHPLEIGGKPVELTIGEYKLPVFNLQIAQIFSVILILIFFRYAYAGMKSHHPNALQRTLSGFVLWIRDEMVVPVLGDHLAHKLLPYFLSVFFFIATSNLLGLLPNPFYPFVAGAGLLPFGVTSTACIFVTAGLAICTFLMMIVGGMVMNGPIKFWTGLVPHGIPAALWPLMFIVEIIGLCVKPFALTIRLFANMTGGHLVVLSFMGLIFYFGETLHNMAYGVAIPAVGFAVFIMIIEAFVALLQAYIFTLLSLLFVGASLHPEH
ncbi:MAG: F0F1 ATP synthase subunit A [Planctomycetota bacterium]